MAASKTPFIIAGMVTVAAINAALWFIGEFALYPYAAGAGTGLLVAAIGFMTDKH